MTDTEAEMPHRVTQTETEHTIDTDVIQAMELTPWKPPPKHSRQMIRTNLEATDDESDEEVHEELEDVVDWIDDKEETKQCVNGSTTSDEHTPSKPQGFRVAESDSTRCGISMRCLMRNHAKGIVDGHIGHHAKCRKKINGVGEGGL